MNILKDNKFKKHLKTCNFKDKVKKILDIEDDEEEKILALLETIVSENSRLEDIEDRKVQVDYERVFNKGAKSVEDKIKAILKEYGHTKMGDSKRILEFYRKMQSLLEKE